MISKSAYRRRDEEIRRAAVMCTARLLFFLWCGIEPAAATQADHESILAALRTAGLSSSATALNIAITKLGFQVPPRATIFVPTNAAVEQSCIANLVDVFSHHVTTQHLPVDSLTSLPVGTQLPTLLTNNTLLVTDNNSPSNVRINHRELMAADLCTEIQTVACYKVDAVFDNAAWDQALYPALYILATAPIRPPVHPPVGAPLPPPAGAPVRVPVRDPVRAPVRAPVAPPASPPVPAPLAPGTPGHPPGAAAPAPAAAVMLTPWHPFNAGALAALVITIFFA